MKSSLQIIFEQQINYKYEKKKMDITPIQIQFYPNSSLSLAISRRNQITVALMQSDLICCLTKKMSQVCEKCRNNGVFPIAKNLKQSIDIQ